MLREFFTSLHELLARHRAFWSKEIIEQYPGFLEIYPRAWVADVMELSAEQIYDLELNHSLQNLADPELKQYFTGCWSAPQIRAIARNGGTEFARHTFVNVKSKKQHEIECLTSVVRDLHRTHDFEQVVDFGGGVGFFAQTLAQSCGIRTITLDCDPVLQHTGRMRHEKFAPKNTALEFIELDCRQAACRLLPELSGKKLFFGLHTCGALANDQLRAAVLHRAPAVLNFSCCYYKMDQNAYYLSEFGKRSDLRLPQQALTLATRSPRPTREAFARSKRVKAQRYLMHLFLHHEIGIKEFVSLGKSPHRLYECGFPEYAAEQLSRLGIDSDAGMQRRLADFAAAPEHLLTVRQMVAANIIRSATGRAIELLLLLDRALYLEENGYAVSLAEYFDPLVSPRNIGILAVRSDGAVPLSSSDNHRDLSGAI